MPEMKLLDTKALALSSRGLKRNMEYDKCAKQPNLKQMIYFCKKVYEAYLISPKTNFL